MFVQHKQCTKVIRMIVLCIFCFVDCRLLELHTLLKNISTSTQFCVFQYYRYSTHFAYFGTYQFQTPKHSSTFIFCLPVHKIVCVLQICETRSVVKSFFASGMVFENGVQVSKVICQNK